MLGLPGSRADMASEGVSKPKAEWDVERVLPPVCWQAEGKLCLLLIFCFFLCVHVRSMVLVGGRGQLCRKRFPPPSAMWISDGTQVLRLSSNAFCLLSLLFGPRAVLLILSLSSLSKVQKWVARFCSEP